jgi:hypothetical protein
MSDEYNLTLRQADQARADFAAIDDSLNLIMRMLVPLPTRKEMYQAALLGVLTGAGLVEALRLLFG